MPCQQAEGRQGRCVLDLSAIDHRPELFDGHVLHAEITFLGIGTSFSLRQTGRHEHMAPLRRQPVRTEDVAETNQRFRSQSRLRLQLFPGDLRGNYFMTGTTWTIGGAPPNGGNEVGTNVLANTTMETYQQGANCFACHQSTFGSPVSTTDISHIFGPLRPLF